MKTSALRFMPTLLPVTSAAWRASRGKARRPIEVVPAGLIVDSDFGPVLSVVIQKASRIRQIAQIMARLGLTSADAGCPWIR